MSVINRLIRRLARVQFWDALIIAVFASLVVFAAEFDAWLYRSSVPSQVFPLASPLLTYAFCALSAVLSLLLFKLLLPLRVLAAIALYTLGFILYASAAMLVLGAWISPIKLLLSVSVAFLMWLSLRAKSAQDAIDVVLQNMRDELSHLGMEPEEDMQESIADSQQSRIFKLMLTTQHLRDLHKSRNDALMFISHDIRTPLGAAILLLDKLEKTKYTERMQQLLERAHLMAEGFVHATRAESADVNKFKVIDMISLTEQVVDDLYALIQAKQLRVNTQFPESSVMVRGDYGLLFRAVSNVLLNAVNYSPANSTVEIFLTADSNFLELKIIDEGPGIPENKLTKLFKRFSRAEGEYQANNGCGLGLYFVNVTVKKHRGNIDVKNLVHRGAEFVIRLPLERRKVNLHVPYERRADTASSAGDSA